MALLRWAGSPSHCSGIRPQPEPAALDQVVQGASASSAATSSQRRLGRPCWRPASRQRPRTRPTSVRGRRPAPAQGRGCAAPTRGSSTAKTPSPRRQPRPLPHRDGVAIGSQSGDLTPSGYPVAGPLSWGFAARREGFEPQPPDPSSAITRPPRSFPSLRVPVGPGQQPFCGSESACLPARHAWHGRNVVAVSSHERQT
jgi:hypothetical protein